MGTGHALRTSSQLVARLTRRKTMASSSASKRASNASPAPRARGPRARSGGASRRGSRSWWDHPTARADRIKHPADVPRRQAVRNAPFHGSQIGHGKIRIQSTHDALEGRAQRPRTTVPTRAKSATLPSSSIRAPRGICDRPSADRSRIPALATISPRTPPARVRRVSLGQRLGGNVPPPGSEGLADSHLLRTAARADQEQVDEPLTSHDRARTDQDRRRCIISRVATASLAMR